MLLSVNVSVPVGATAELVVPKSLFQRHLKSLYVNELGGEPWNTLDTTSPNRPASVTDVRTTDRPYRYKSTVVNVAGPVNLRAAVQF